MQRLQRAHRGALSPALVQSAQSLFLSLSGVCKTFDDPINANTPG